MTQLIPLTHETVFKEELTKHVVVFPSKLLGADKYYPYRKLEDLLKKAVVDKQLFCAPRGKELEEDTSVVQLATYALLMNAGTDPPSIFGYSRGSESERRLDNNESIGFGGHVDVGDLVDGVRNGLSVLNCISAAVRREIKEEAPQLECEQLPSFVSGLYVGGEDAAPVDKVHFGLLYLGWAKRTGEETGDVGAIKSYTLDQLWTLRREKKLERWSREAVQFVSFAAAQKAKDKG